MLKCSVKRLLAVLVALFALATVQTTLGKCPDMSGIPAQSRPCGSVEAAKGSPDRSDIASGHHLLWTVSGPKGSAYLLGSLHFGKPEMFPLPAEITRAFDASQALVVETNINALDPAQIAKIVAAKAMYTDGRTLSQVLTPATWQQLDKVMKEFGATAQLVDRQKAWFVSLTLTSLALKRFGFDENLGIDNHFMKLADKKKPIIEMETFEQQLEFLNGFSEDEQEEMLKETFDDIEKGRAFLVETLNAWQAGDARKIDELLNEEFRNTNKTDEHMYRVLITERNAAMVAKLDRLLNKGGKYFVVLGAAHFVGRDGIVELLRDKGYHVRQD